MASKNKAAVNGKPPQINVSKSADDKAVDKAKKPEKTNPWKQFAISVSEQKRSKSTVVGPPRVTNGNDPIPSTSVSQNSEKASLAVPGSVSPILGKALKDGKVPANSISPGSISSSIEIDSVSRSESRVDLQLQNAHPTTEAAEEKPKVVIANNNTYIQSAIPYMPMTLAVICLMLNMLLPGTGEISYSFHINFVITFSK